MSRSTFIWLFIPATIVYILGFGVEIMNVDSAQYAAISREMTETGSYLQVYLRGVDYLDKPPLLFWVNSLFFNLFGYANWSFKIGSFLFTLVGVYSTFRLGKLLYDTGIGRLAALMLYSCQAFFLFNNDIRTDTILTGATIFSIWQLVEWLTVKKWKWLIGASLGLGFAMLAKGPIGLMVPVLAVGSYLLGKNRFKDFVRWEYLVIIGLILVMLSPMLWGLYNQFDRQPDKGIMMPTSEGLKYETGISGIKFYFWTQSFGRITGESGWSDGSGPFFFVHNFIWSFLPWSLLFIIAFFWQLSRIIRGFVDNRNLPEMLTTGGFLLPFIAFSMSTYKLPHYIFILYPLAAIITAVWWDRIWSASGKLIWRRVSVVLQFLIWLVVGLILYMILFRFFPGASVFLMVTCLAFLVIASYFIIRGAEVKNNLIIASVCIAVGANIGINAWFYPQVLQYQAGERILNAVEANNIDKSELYPYNFYDFAYHYYLGLTEIPKINDELIEEKLENGEKVYLVTKDPYIQDIRSDFDVDILFRMGNHSVTRLNMEFLDPETRPRTLKQIYLVEILNKKEE